MQRPKIELPPCGIFIGSGIYPMSGDDHLSTLRGHQSWMLQSFAQSEKILEDNRA